MKAKHCLIQVHCSTLFYFRLHLFLQVHCSPLGHADSQPYPSEEIVHQFFKEVFLKTYRMKMLTERIA